MKYLAREKHAVSRRLKIDFDRTWVDYNPSLVPWRGELLCSFRVTNMTCCDCGHWLLPPHQHYDNQLVLGFLDQDYKVLRQRTIPVRDLPGAGSFPRGLEDLRLYTSPSGSLHAIAASNDFPKMEVVRLDFADDLSITNAVVYPSPFNQTAEKNWLPFTSGNETLVVYHWEPLSVRRFLSNGTTEAVPIAGPAVSFPGWRGSSQGVETADGWLFVIHRRAFRAQHKVYTLDYTHRLVELGRDFRPRRISEEFRFISPGIEFCGGLARVGERFLFTLGKYDAQSHLVSVPVDAIEQMLLPFTDETLPLHDLPSVPLDGDIDSYYRHRKIPLTFRSLARETYLTLNHYFCCLPRLRR